MTACGIPSQSMCRSSAGLAPQIADKMVTPAERRWERSCFYTSTTSVFGDALAPPAVVARRVPGYETEHARRGWRMNSSIGRVYVNERARRELGWEPRYDFQHVVDRLRAGEDPRSELAQTIGSKGYHAEVFSEGPYPVE